MRISGTVPSLTILVSHLAKPKAAPQRNRARPGRALTVEPARQLLDAAVGYRFEAAVSYWP